MQPALVAAAALFITLQALTGFATSDGVNNVPALKQKTHIAATRAGGLIATPTGERPKALGTSGAKALAYNVVYYNHSSLRIAVRLPSMSDPCQGATRTLLQRKLNHSGHVKIESAGNDTYQRPIGILYDEAGKDVAEAVSAISAKAASCQR